jgi:hypothetical protein
MPLTYTLILLHTRSIDELRKQRERIEAEQYANHQKRRISYQWMMAKILIYYDMMTLLLMGILSCYDYAMIRPVMLRAVDVIVVGKAL